MMASDADFCARRIAEEELLGNEAIFTEAAASHLQLVMLYRSQLTTLMRRSEGNPRRGGVFGAMREAT